MICRAKNKRARFIKIILLILVLVSIIITIYYLNFSVRIEPLIYLHNKYNIKYSDMEIIKTTKYQEPFIDIGEGTALTIPRSATILYKQNEIYVYYDYESWSDNYDTTKNFIK